MCWDVCGDGRKHRKIGHKGNQPQDITEFLINDSNSNITIAEDKIVNISEINLSEVV